MHDVPSAHLPDKNGLGPRIWATLDPFVEGGPILGRRVANTTFLEAFLRADPFDGYHFFLADKQREDTLRTWLHEHYPVLMRRNAVYIGQSAYMQGHLASTPYHCMHLSDAVSHYSQLLQMRNAASLALFPVTGLTHSLSYARFMPEYAKLVWPGTGPRDAIIVTSESAKRIMERAFHGVRQGYGLLAEQFPAPQLARIPLGVNAAAFPEPRERWDAEASVSGVPDSHNLGLAMRRRLGIGAETAFLCFSRVSPYSKMDIMPLFSAFKRAESLGLAKEGYVLILAGWAEEDDPLPESLHRYALSMGIPAHLLLRPSDEERRGLYAAADVFVSPSDNIQETFGLTVAEAGMASLPVIASDFDGYRDIVVHGETGLLIPTLGFADSGETDIQALFWYDNQYHLKLSQQTVVSVPLLAQALVRLGTDPALRRKMGAAGRARSLELYSWDRVVQQYVALWDRLAAIPLSPEEEQRIRGAAHPLRMRFAQYFQGHFSSVLNEKQLEEMVLQRTPSGDALYRDVLPLVQYAGMEHLLDREAVRRLLLAARKPVQASQIMGQLLDFFSGKTPFPPLARERAAFTLLWALKHDFLEQLS